MRIAEAKLVEVVLKVLRRNGVVGPVQAPLELTPKAVDGLRVDRAPDILPGAVLHALMDEAHALGAVVDAALVRGQDGARRGVGRQERHDRSTSGVRDGRRLDAATALHHAEHGRLAFRADATLTARVLAADVGLVGLKHPAQDFAVIGHEQTDLTGHAPRALVGHADLPLNLLGRDSVLRRGEQEDGVEPGQERRRALVEDGVHRRADLMAAPRTGVSLAARARVEALRLAAIAHGAALAVAGHKQERETGGVRRELRLEGLDGVFHLGDSHSSAIPSAASGRLFHAFISAAGPIAPQYSDPPGYWTLEKQTTLGISDLVSILIFFPPQNGQGLNCVFISPSEVDVHISTYALRLFLGIACAAYASIPLFPLALDNLDSANVPFAHISPRRRSVIPDDLQQIPNIDFVFHTQSIAVVLLDVKG